MRIQPAQGAYDWSTKMRAFIYREHLLLLINMLEVIIICSISDDNTLPAEVTSHEGAFIVRSFVSVRQVSAPVTFPVSCTDLSTEVM